MSPQPLDQARSNAYALRNLVRDAVPDLARLEVEYGVALPNTAAIVGHLPPGMVAEQALTATSLEDVTEAIELLATVRYNSVVLTADHVGAIVALLCPSADFAWDAGARLQSSRRRLDELAGVQIQALERLDRNRRVVALGAAGTGKTRLAVAWARRAFARDERVLITCYNDPLAERTAEQLPDDGSLRVGSFMRLALGLDGLPPLAVPVDAGHHWWNVTALDHLRANWASVTERFDTIVVDEAQDFDPEWIDLLAELLDPDGSGRLFLLADPAQEIYGRGFVVPGVDDGWTQCELVSNCRNAREIGNLLRRRLGGAPAPALGPEATGLTFVTAADEAAALAAGRAEIDRLVVDEERDPAQLLVLTFSSRLRDQLREVCALVAWEDRSDGIVCETVHRAKGLEADTVVLVADRPEVADDLLYIGISRAVSELVVIGPTGLARRLGLAPGDSGA